MREDIQAMQVFIDTMVGIPKFAYPAKKNAPRPTGEFATVQLIEQYVVGMPVKGVEAEVLDAGVVVGYVYRNYSAVKLRFRITVVETSGIPSTKIANAWMIESMKELMKTLGYGYLSCKPISLEDALLEKDWEPRQGFSVELSTTRMYDETVDLLGQVSPIDGIFYEGLTEHLVHVEINPPV